MASDCQFWRKPCDCDKAPGIACCGTDSARENCHFYQRARADALQNRLEEAGEHAERLAGLLVRWQEHAQECESAVKLAWSHGVEVPPTTIGDDTDEALANHEARKKAGGAA